MRVEVDSNFVMATVAVLTAGGAVAMFAINAIVAKQNQKLLEKIEESSDREFKKIYRWQESQDHKIEENTKGIAELHGMLQGNLFSKPAHKT